MKTSNYLKAAISGIVATAIAWAGYPAVITCIVGANQVNVFYTSIHGFATERLIFSLPFLIAGAAIYIAFIKPGSRIKGLSVLAAAMLSGLLWLFFLKIKLNTYINLSGNITKAIDFSIAVEDIAAYQIGIAASAGAIAFALGWQILNKFKKPGK